MAAQLGAGAAEAPNHSMGIGEFNGRTTSAPLASHEAAAAA
jgi:hypothetical protein